MAEGLPADAPLPAWFLRDLEANKATASEAEKEKKREAVRSSNPYMMQEGLPKFESITPEASKEVRSALYLATPPDGFCPRICAVDGPAVPVAAPMELRDRQSMAAISIEL